MNRASLETDYVHALMARASVALPDVRLFRRNTGLIRLEHKGDPRVFRAGIPGQADIYALGRGGQHYEIEVKRFGKLSEAQERWRDWCRSWDVPWLLLEVRRAEPETETVHRWMRELVEFFGS
jgi:hypothetical protein